MVVGSKIFKGDLHVHSPNSGDDFKENGVTPEKLILAAKDKGLDFIAITDHNTFNYTQLIPYIKEGKKHNVTVFPGLELDVEEGRKGIHVICIFDSELDKKLFDEISGELSLHKILRKSISGYQKGFAKLRDTITQYDGLLIAAHVNHPDKGFIKNVEGAHKKSKFDSAQFDAMENAKNPDLFDGSDKWFAKKTACIESSDAHTLKDIGTKYSYYKMDEPTIQNLRRALNDPDMRIFSETPFEFTHFWIEELTVDSRDGPKGYLHGVCMKFNPNLNCLIGGRGAGKSMVLEAIGYALEIDVKAYEKYRSLGKYDKIIRHAIGERGSVSLLVNYQNIKYKIQRSFGLSSTIWLNDEKVYDHNRPEFPYVFQSQNQITTITDEEEIYSRFLDSLGATAEIRHLKKLISKKIDQLRKNRFEIYEIQQNVDDFVGVKDEYDTIKRNIKRLSKTITKYTNNKDSATYFEMISNSVKSKLI
jgi:predicted metal-dependent phosphoesterase TrpH